MHCPCFSRWGRVDWFPLSKDPKPFLNFLFVHDNTLATSTTTKVARYNWALMFGSKTPHCVCSARKVRERFASFSWCAQNETKRKKKQQHQKLHGNIRHDRFSIIVIIVVVVVVVVVVVPVVFFCKGQIIEFGFGTRRFCVQHDGLQGCFQTTFAH